MLIRIGMESNVEGRSLAWALDYPGCFAYGQDNGEALMRIPQALLAYERRVAARAADPWVAVGDFDLRVVESWRVYCVSDQYEFAGAGREVNAWFQDDWKPLTAVEIDRALQMARWNREDLLATVSGLPPEILDRPHPGERWSARGILKHVASAEWWYLDRLGLADPAVQDAPADAFERLAQSRRMLEAALPALEGKEMVRGKDAEFWSPRKLVRRALWHEIDHIEHLFKLLTA